MGGASRRAGYSALSRSAAGSPAGRTSHAQLARFQSGVGVFVNYLLLAIWVFDLGWWWISGRDSYLKRPRALVLAWHAFLIFIIFNATVVFCKGLTRWVGLAISLVLGLGWIIVTKQLFSQKPDREGGQLSESDSNHKGTKTRSEN